VLLGRRKEEMLALFEELHHSPEGIEFIEPKAYIHRQQFVDAYYKMGQRKGITLERANLDLRNYYYFGSMMVREGHVDGMVAGATSSFYDVLKPVQRIIGPKADGRLIAGMYLLNHENKQYCLADCTVNIYPDPEELAEIALLSASEMEYLGLNPRIAMLSFSNFGSYKSEEASRVTQAVKIIHKKRPDLMADGPVQADFALDPDFMKKHFPFSDLKARPNLLVFPSLDSGNISLKLLRKLSHSNTVGPIMIGLARPIQILPRGAEINTIINLTAIACVDAQNLAVKASQYIREFA
jgi:malate dehydrogenase (oxaloacetate-decarboxylating)(NADP+)